ncbi:MAG: PHP domain-containing protein [Planctomycetes bacterium]|nr:PHP domain-containing protein [Planctomycetota bacterium]
MRPLPILVALLAAAPAALAHDRPIVFPDVDGALTLVVDLHTHSVFSDGNVWPTIRVEEAERDGLDLLAVTEHLEYQPHADDIPHPDRNRSFELASQHAARGGEHPRVIVVNGAEITRKMPPGHANAVFLSDANALLHDDVEDAFAAAHAQGAFVFWNHPMWTGQRADGIAVLTDLHRSLIERGLLQGIEVANGEMVSNEALQIALDHDLTMLGVSDVHGLIDWEAHVHEGDGGHRTVTLVFAAERSAEAVREALFAHRTVAYVGDTLIGRDAMLQPLLAASLTVARVGVRPNSKLVDVTLENQSDATFDLADAGGQHYYEHLTPLRVPAHGTLTFGLAGEARTTFELEFEVLNAVSAPGVHPHLKLAVEVPHD